MTVLDEELWHYTKIIAINTGSTRGKVSGLLQYIVWEP